MSSFCSQCCNNFGMQADIDLFKLALSLINDRSITFICEGCNNRAVYKYKVGNIYFAEYVANEIYLFPVNISELIPINSIPPQPNGDYFLGRAPSIIPMAKYNNHLIKILASHTLKYFRTGHGNLKIAQENKQYVFKCRMLEIFNIFLPHNCNHLIS